jgi:predicted RNase H-like HicB family nuclease
MLTVSSAFQKMSIKLRDIKTKVIREKDGSYAIACSALGVYTVGETLAEAKKNFGEALELHLSALKERAIEAVA